MKINKGNIEEYIFDYLEGNLSDQQISEFREYVNSDAEAKSELDFWKQSYVTSQPVVNASEFNHLKRTNKLAKWAGGTAAAFLIGAGSMYFVMQDTTQPVEMEQSEATPQIESIAPADVAEKANVETFTVDNPSTTSTQTVVESVESEMKDEESVSPNEDIDYLNQRNIELELPETDRSTVTKKVVVSKSGKSDKKDKNKKTEVEVIELNSEGF